MIDPFPIPDEVLIDEATGLALNIPASLQEYPNWWNEEPERYDQLQQARKAAGIKIDDFPTGVERIVEPVKYIPMGQ